MILKAAPDVVGLDIIFPWEIIQARSIVQMIHRILPKTHVNFLGHGFDELCFARVSHRMENNPHLFFGFDSIFLVRNDSALKKFYHLDDYTPDRMESIQSLAYNIQGRIGVNSPLKETNIDFCVMPDYSDLNLDLYYTPELVLVEKLSSKCYWSKCSYCNINLFKSNRTEAPLSLFVERLKAYGKKYNCTHFWILDEAVHPQVARELAERLLEEEMDITWSIRTRIEEDYDESLLQLLRETGCREMWIGLEAVSPRLLRDMNKTDSPETYADIASCLIERCSRIGIGLHFCLILGFPTETPTDQQLLMDFFQDHNKYFIDIPFFATFNIFNLKS